MVSADVLVVVCVRPCYVRTWSGVFPASENLVRDIHPFSSALVHERTKKSTGSSGRPSQPYSEEHSTFTHPAQDAFSRCTCGACVLLAYVGTRTHRHRADWFSRVFSISRYSSSFSGYHTSSSLHWRHLFSLLPHRVSTKGYLTLPTYRDRQAHPNSCFDAESKGRNQA